MLAHDRKLLRDLLLSKSYIWLLVAVAMIGDAWALFTFDPERVTLTIPTVFLVIVTFCAEIALLFAILEHLQGRESNFIDAYMSAVTMPVAFAVKAVLLIIPAAIYVTISVLPFTIVLLAKIPFGFVFFFLPFLILVQVWSCFALCGLYVPGYSIGETLTTAWFIMRKNGAQLLGLATLFIAVDVAVFLTIVAAGGLSSEEIITYTVTEEVAEVNRLNLNGTPQIAGEYVAPNRPVNGMLAAFFKTRGTELLSVATTSFTNKIAAIIYLIFGFILLPLRLIPLVNRYWHWGEVAKHLERNRETQARISR